VLQRVKRGEIEAVPGSAQRPGNTPAQQVRLDPVTRCRAAHVWFGTEGFDFQNGHRRSMRLRFTSISTIILRLPENGRFKHNWYSQCARGSETQGSRVCL
jgi:hypothetical protein